MQQVEDESGQATQRSVVSNNSRNGRKNKELTLTGFRAGSYFQMMVDLRNSIFSWLNTPDTLPWMYSQIRSPTVEVK